MKVAVLDLETDPFEYGRMIHPFLAGFYDGSAFTSYWSADCVDRMVAYLNTQNEPLTIYAHNGGRFDWFYFIKHIHREVRIVNSRIIQAWLGKHELRDSFAIMPFPLAAYKKTPIDYNKMSANNRESNREEITSYLRDDCLDLYTLVTAFITEFGPALTIGAASMKQLKRFHKFTTGNQEYDEKFRKDFYFGGRNQVFQAGIIQGPIKVYDVNSMYPDVMRRCLHPVSVGIYRSSKIEANTAFITVEGWNDGAFPQRQKDHSLDFTVEYGTFHTSIHEFEAALETKTFRPKKIIETRGFSERITFAEFVDHFYNARLAAKASGDVIHTLFYKFVMNSGYGKFAQNPENYCDYFITSFEDRPPTWHECDKACDEDCRKRWSPSFISGNDYIIWSKPLAELHYFNIATGASITGAARAMLLKGLYHAVDPMYVDTDSIICRGLDSHRSRDSFSHLGNLDNQTGITIDEHALGAWKLEAEGTHAAICGKKLYAIFNGDECIKKAHKGARLTGKDILSIASGAIVESLNPVPSFKFDGSHSFTKRRIKATGKIKGLVKTV